MAGLLTAGIGSANATTILIADATLNSVEQEVYAEISGTSDTDSDNALGLSEISVSVSNSGTASALLRTNFNQSGTDVVLSLLLADISAVNAGPPSTGDAFAFAAAEFTMTDDSSLSIPGDFFEWTDTSVEAAGSNLDVEISIGLWDVADPGNPLIDPATPQFNSNDTSGSSTLGDLGPFALSNGVTYRFEYLVTTTATGNTLQGTQGVSLTIPEPSTALSLLAGLGLLALRRRRLA